MALNFALIAILGGLIAVFAGAFAAISSSKKKET
jgi:hypothetical protein